MKKEAGEAAWKTLLAFAIIYLVWGSTFLAIRVGVREVPPFLLAAMRFTAAGLLLCGWLMARGERLPDRWQWASIGLLALLIFVFDYGLLFWAEQRVPSGIAAVMMATIPLFTALGEIALLRTKRLTRRLALALLMGLIGVGVLVGRSIPFGSGSGGAAIDIVGAGALIAGAISWSLASVLMRKLPLPASKGMSSGTQMLFGGVLLTAASAGLGEFHSFHPASVSREAWLALLYLIGAGSILGFTAYVWLIHRQSPTKVGTYAYVNPVVAVVIGYFLAGETVGPRTFAGTLLILASIVVITTAKAGERRAKSEN